MAAGVPRLSSRHLPGHGRRGAAYSAGLNGAAAETSSQTAHRAQTLRRAGPARWLPRCWSLGPTGAGHRPSEGRLGVLSHWPSTAPRSARARGSRGGDGRAALCAAGTSPPPATDRTASPIPSQRLLRFLARFAVLLAQRDQADGNVRPVPAEPRRAQLLAEPAAPPLGGAKAKAFPGNSASSPLRRARVTSPTPPGPEAVAGAGGRAGNACSPLPRPAALPLRGAALRSNAHG